ncbi:MAG: PspA/IM30 family protein [Polyangiaceae bacterium]
MGIFDRMGKVISSNVNSLLDRGEDERKLVELNLDEMEEQLRRARQEVISAVATEKQIRKKGDDLQAEVAKWEKRAELALKTGDESLAREALKQKKRVSGESEANEKGRAEAFQVALTMRSELDRMEAKFKEVKAQKNTIAARAEAAKAGTMEDGLGARGGESAFANFRKLEDKIAGREEEASAMREVEEALGGPQKADLEAKFRELERGAGGASTQAGTAQDIEDELAALKKKIRV